MSKRGKAPALAPVIPDPAAAPAPALNVAATPRPTFDQTVYDAKLAQLATDVRGVYAIKTDCVAALGGQVADILAYNRERSAEWTPKTFDDTMSAIKTYVETSCPDLTYSFDAVNAYKLFSALALAVELGIPGSEGIAVKRWNNFLFGAAFSLDKATLALTVRPGWADWLKSALPLNVAGPDSMSAPALATSIDEQRKALVALDPVKYAGSKPKAPKTPKAPATPKTSTPPPAIPPVGKVKAPVAAPVATSTPIITPSAIVAVAATLKTEDATALGLALVKANNIGAMMALYKTMAATIKAHREASKAAPAVA